MYNLINKDNGNYIGLINGELYEMDLRNFRYDLNDESNNFKYSGLEHSLAQALSIFFRNLDLKIKIQYSGVRWTLKGFVQRLHLKFHLLHIGLVGAEKYFSGHSNYPYKYGGQGKFVSDIQIFTAYNFGKANVRISEKTFVKMIGKNYGEYVSKSKGISKAQVFGTNVLIENKDYDGYYISKSE